MTAETSNHDRDKIPQVPAAVPMAACASGQAEFAALFMDLFAGRQDRIGTRSRMSTPIADAGQIASCHVPGHLDGRERIGFYNMLPDSTVNWAVVEFEAHGTQSVKDPGAMAVKFMQLAREAGLWAYRERSKSGGENYHVWMFFESPVLAGKVRKLLIGLLDRLGLAEAGRPKVEVFPSGDSAHRTLGKLVWLPFFGGADNVNGKPGHGVREGCTVFLTDNGEVLDPLTFVQGAKKNSLVGIDDAISFFGLDAGEPAAGEDAQKQVKVPAVVEEEELLGPLLKNCPKFKTLLDEQLRRSKDGSLPAGQRGIDWDSWDGLVGLLCHFGKLGERLIHRFSSQSPKYDPVGTQRAIDERRRKNVPPTTCAKFNCNRSCFSQPSPVRWIYKAEHRKTPPPGAG